VGIAGLQECVSYDGAGDRGVRAAGQQVAKWSSIPVRALAWVPSAKTNPPGSHLRHRLVVGDNRPHGLIPLLGHR